MSKQVQKSNFRNIAENVAVGVGLCAISAISFASENVITIDDSKLVVTGLAAGAGTVFGVKATPSLLMWGYRRLLGFIR